MRGGFPTPNESSLRSGLTPGGSGSMFPAPSPNSQALFAQLASGGATPSTLDFHRTALSAAAKREQAAAPHQVQSATSQPQDMPNGTALKPEGKSGPFDPHDNDAANGLFLLAQGRNQGANAQFNNAAAATGMSAQAHTVSANQANAAVPSAKVNGGPGHTRGASEVSNMSEDQTPSKPNTRGKGKKAQTAVSTRRKAEEPPAAKPPPAKKAKSIPVMPSFDQDMSDEDDEDDGDDEGGAKSKMTDEEKRKNFLERNRYVHLHISGVQTFANDLLSIVWPLSSVVNVRSNG